MCPPEEVHSTPLPRLCSESIRIHNNICEIPMNSKAEWHQPVVARVVVTRELEELEEPNILQYRYNVPILKRGWPWSAALE